MQSQTERDMSGLERLRAERAREKLHRVTGKHVPQGEFDDDIDTGRTERIDSDPELHRLYVKSEHNRALILEAKREAADLVLEAAGERPPDDRFKAIEKRVKRWHWLITVIAIPAITSILIVVKYLMLKSAADERSLVERERMIEQIRDMRSEISGLKSQLRDVENLARRNETRLDSWRRRDQPDPQPRVNQ